MGFIDDVLVLDIGGIHNPVGGSINFKTGVVTVESAYPENSVINDSQRGPEVQTTIQQCFANARRTWNPEPYSNHTIRVFYLERGGCYSNCRMEFNLTLFKDIEFDKKDNLGSGVPDAEFRLYKQDNTSLMETYYDYEDETYKEREYVRISDENGHVKFDHVPVGTYYLKEISAPEGYLSDDTTYIVKIEVVRQEGQEGYEIHSYILNENNQNVTEIENTTIDYIDVGAEKKWTGDPPDGATATFALRRTRSYETDEVISKCTLEVYRVSQRWSSPSLISSKDYAGNANARVKWNYSWNQYPNNNREYMIDGTNEVLQIGSDYNWVTVPMQESGTVKLYIKDGNNSVQNAVFRDHNNSEVRYGDEFSRIEVSDLTIDAINKPAPGIQIYKVYEDNINEENVEQYLLSGASFKIVKYKSFTPLEKDTSWGTDGDRPGRYA